MQLKTLTQMAFDEIKKLRIHVVLIYCFYQFISMLLPLSIGKLLDIFTVSLYKGIRVAIFCLVLIVAIFLLNWYQNYMWFKMKYTGTGKLRIKVFSEIQKNEFKFFSNQSSGDIINKIVNDVEQYAEISLIKFPMLTMNITTLVFVFGFVFWLNPIICLLLTLLSTLYFVTYKYINQKLRVHTLKEKRSYSSLVNSITSFYNGIVTIKLFRSTRFFEKLFRDDVHKLIKESTSLRKWKSLSQSLVMTLGNIMPFITIVVGVLLILQGKCTIGTVFSIYSYTNLISEPIHNLTDFNIMLQQGRISGERIEALLKVESDERGCLSNNIQKIEIDKLNFYYEQNQSILSNISCTLQKGQKLALTGKSGSGKSSFLKILSGQQPYNEGSIRVNGQELKDINEDSHLRHIAVLPQDVFLFQGSVLDNICLGREVQSEKLYEIINILELEECLGRNVDDLSGGEKRRIGIARALVGDYDLLLLDEPTSNLDEQMERKIVHYIDTLVQKENKILVVTTHRPAFLEVCDNRIQLDRE